MDREQALNLVKEAADYARKLTTQLGIGGRVNVDDSGDDPAVEISGRFLVYPTNSPQEWTLDVLTYDPGVRYHKDGPGTRLQGTACDRLRKHRLRGMDERRGGIYGNLTWPPSAQNKTAAAASCSRTRQGSGRR